MPLNTKSKPKTIVLIKKRKPSSDSHGGAWKVAYADFVTALMALFIVLWLMNMSPQMRAAVAGYFRDPMGTSSATGSDRVGSAENLPITKDNFKQLKARLEKAINQVDSLKALSNQIDITITPEGLRIELLETRDGSFFEVGSAVLNANGREILTLLAKELGTVPNRIMIEGHTDARPYTGNRDYNNWNLSAARALAARSLMMVRGLRPNQVSEIRGYADEMLRDKANPYDPSNRRITLVVQYLDPEAPVEGHAIPPESGTAARVPSTGGATGTGAQAAPRPRGAHARAAETAQEGFFSRLLADVLHP